MKNKLRKRMIIGIAVVGGYLGGVMPATGQSLLGGMSLQDAIRIAHSRSPQAQMAQLTFLAQYWNFRSYKAGLLPSLNLGANAGQYNRSLVEVRDPDTGEISYVANNTLTNDLSLSVDQNIALTGGRVSLNTMLARLDQFTYANKIYNSNPVTINYTQPLRAFNTFKWQKKTAPLQYENSKRRYLENIEEITINVTSFFFSVLSAQNDYKKAVDNYKDTKQLYQIAQKRFAINSINKSDLLQLELSLLNSDLAIHTSRVGLDMAIFSFTSYLGIAGSTDLKLIPPSAVPGIELVYDIVLARAYENSTHHINQELKLINAAKAVAQAKANKGLEIDLKANLGLSQSARDFKGAYTDVKDREVVGVTLRMPVYDWGMGRGRVRMAEAEERLARTEVQQEEIKFCQDIKIKVIQFNNQAKQCEISQKARLVADERYEITKKRFQNGSVSVTDLNTSQKEKDDAQMQYISQLRTFWTAYFEIRKLSLYDYIDQKDISAEFDALIEK